MPWDHHFLSSDSSVHFGVTNQSLDITSFQQNTAAATESLLPQVTSYDNLSHSVNHCSPWTYQHPLYDRHQSVLINQIEDKDDRLLKIQLLCSLLIPITTFMLNEGSITELWDKIIIKTQLWEELEGDSLGQKLANQRRCHWPVNLGSQVWPAAEVELWRECS